MTEQKLKSVIHQKLEEKASLEEMREVFLAFKKQGGQQKKATQILEKIRLELHDKEEEENLALEFTYSHTAPTPAFHKASFNAGISFSNSSLPTTFNFAHFVSNSVRRSLEGWLTRGMGLSV